MTLVRLRAPLRQRAGDRAEHEVDGATVVELLRALEQAHPELAGWILDERGRLRRHINVYVNGERRDPEGGVSADDAVDVLPAISGG
jgi:molybdopterin converting factor small subunit